MKQPLQITYRNVEPSPAIEADIRDRAAKLERYSEDIIGCRVVVESPHGSHNKGNHYRVLVDLTIPGEELVAGRYPTEHDEHEDLYVAIRDAFNAVTRELKEASEKRRDAQRRATV